MTPPPFSSDSTLNLNRISLPSGWSTLDVGNTHLFIHDNDHARRYRLVFAYICHDSGDYPLHHIVRFDPAGEQAVVFEEIGEPTKTRKELQDRLNQYPERADSEKA